MKVRRVERRIFEVEFTDNELEVWAAIATQLGIKIVHLLFGLLGGGIKNIMFVLKRRE